MNIPLPAPPPPMSPLVTILGYPPPPSLGDILFERLFKAFACVKIARTCSFSGPYSPSFGLNTEIYRVIVRIQSECGKIRTRKTPNTDTFLRSVYCNTFKICMTILGHHAFKGYATTQKRPSRGVIWERCSENMQ